MKTTVILLLTALNLTALSAPLVGPAYTRATGFVVLSDGQKLILNGLTVSAHLRSLKEKVSESKRVQALEMGAKFALYEENITAIQPWLPELLAFSRELQDDEKSRVIFKIFFAWTKG